MKVSVLILFFIINIFHISSSYGQVNSSLLGLKLNTAENTVFNLSDLKNSKATVLIFFLTDCPASQNYTLTIKKLHKKYSAGNISFDIVFPDTYSSPEEVRKFMTDYKLSLPALMDTELTLTKLLKASVAPQCFLLDSKGNIIYDGRIDDWYYKPGKKRTVILSNDLDNAISNFLAGKKIEPAKTTPVGCIINY